MSSSIFCGVGFCEFTSELGSRYVNFVLGFAVDEMTDNVAPFFCVLSQISLMICFLVYRGPIVLRRMVRGHTRRGSNAGHCPK